MGPQEQRLRKKNEYISFMDTIAINGRKIGNGYPAIDYAFHSKRGAMQSFDTDYLYNRRIFIFREDWRTRISAFALIKKDGSLFMSPGVLFIMRGAPVFTACLGCAELL